MDEHTIFVVDDSRVSRMMVKSIINNNFPDREVVEAENGDEALEKSASSVRPVFIIDYNMPGMNGIELAGKIKQRSQDACITMLTANIQDSVKNEADKLGVRFIKKPINEEKINSIIVLSSIP